MSLRKKLNLRLLHRCSLFVFPAAVCPSWSIQFPQLFLSANVCHCSCRVYETKMSFYFLYSSFITFILIHVSIAFSFNFNVLTELILFRVTQIFLLLFCFVFFLSGHRPSWTRWTTFCDQRPWSPGMTWTARSERTQPPCYWILWRKGPSFSQTTSWNRPLSKFLQTI